MRHNLIGWIITAATLALGGCRQEAQPTDKPEAQEQSGSMPANVEFAESYYGQNSLDNHQRKLKALIEAAILPVEGRRAVAVMEIGTNQVIMAGHEGPLPQQSVSKLWVALAAAEKINSGKGSYSDSLTVGMSDRVLFHQPLARKVEAGPVRVTISDLMTLSLTQSDNMANNLLMNYAGGSKAVQDWLKKYAPKIGFGPGDREMQTGISGLRWNPAYADRQAFELARSTVPPQIRAERYKQYTTNPIDGADVESLVRALSALRLGEFPGSSEVLSIMMKTNTGSARLKAGTPAGWTLLHKTGTGQTWNGRTAGFNDIGIMESPNGKSYAVAVMIGDSSSPVATMQNAIANVARAIAAYDARYQPPSETSESEETKI